ncbi:MAG: hypothetical protein NTZ15_15470 [Burkholderiales bacterium]|nr:hypothetical protein [Burkholderiales bacterium]
MKAVLCTLVLALAGCDTVSTKAVSYLYSSMPALAVVDGVAYQGTATVALDRTGSVQLTSIQPPERVCAGNFRYTATTTGVLQLHCAGVPTRMAFTAINDVKAYGWGGTESNPATFTFGMAPQDAAAYLRLPAAAATPMPEPAAPAVPAQPARSAVSRPVT